MLKPETVVIGSNFSPFRNGKNGLCAVTEEESNLLNYGTWCLENDVVDMVALGRQSFADPYLPKKLRGANWMISITVCSVTDVWSF
ncbi:MAG: hypothetical protein V8R80_04910 [Eubacterium sp.]